MACRSAQCSQYPVVPYLGSAPCGPCAPACAPPCPPPCYPVCPPIVGPTGATGATGPAGINGGPVFIVSAALNATTLALTINTLTLIPFNLVVTSNIAGALSFNTSTGIYTVSIPGQYRIDYGVSFTCALGAVAGTGVTVAVRQNLTQLSNATYQFPVTSTAAAINSLNSWWTGAFNLGDQISITVLSNVAVATSLNGPAVSGVAPYNTLFTVRSLF